MRRVEQLLLALLVPALMTCQGDDYQGQMTRGMEMIYEGAYQDAEIYFLALARRLSRRDDPQALSWRARALYQAGKVEHLYLGEPRRAVARLREALKLGIEGNLAFQVQLEIANIFYDRLRDYRNASLEFERLINQFSDQQDTGPYRYRIAQCYFTLRQFDQARAEARLLVESHKDTRLAAEGMLLLANSYYVEGRYREAAEAHAKLQLMHPSDDIASRSLYEQGLCYQQLGALPRAERAFLAALPHHPRPDIVQISLSQVREQMRKEGFPGQEVEATARPGNARPATSPPAPSFRRAAPAVKPSGGKASGKEPVTGTTTGKAGAPRPGKTADTQTRPAAATGARQESRPGPAEKGKAEPATGSTPEEHGQQRGNRRQPGLEETGRKRGKPATGDSGAPASGASAGPAATTGQAPPEKKQPVKKTDTAPEKPSPVPGPGK